MTDIDKVLEAERSIETMSVELGRMKQAADLLGTAQDNADALLRASEVVINQAGKFAGEGAEIIQRLRAMDLESRLGEISRQSAETQALMSRQLDRLNETLERLKERNSEVVQASGILKQEVTVAVQGIGDRLATQVEKTQVEMRKVLSASHENIVDALAQVQHTQIEQLRQARKGQQQALVIAGITLALLTILLVNSFMT